MEDTAFRKPPAPSSHVIVNDKALHRIKDVALEVFMATPGRADTHLVMFEALAIYMMANGASPNFTVVMDGVA